LEEHHRLHVYVPRFESEFAMSMAEALIEMGMPSAFGSADFSGMTGSTDLFISDVIHKAFISVDEEGTEAAAATAVIMARGMSEQIRFDRPFIHLIRDNETGQVVFIGRVLDPTQASK